jgi:hypothetical protein
VIRPMILVKQEWRVKEKSSVPALISSNDDMDLLDDGESPLIKDGSPPLAGMDVNIVFTLPAKFRGVEEVSHSGFKAKPNAHSMCTQESSLHTYRTENGYRITNVSI